MNSTAKCQAIVSALLLSLGGVAGGSGPVPGADLFTNVVRSVRIEIAPVNLAELRRDSRKNVPAKLCEGNKAYADVGVHLKGSTGSFRSMDDKPSFTLNLGKFRPGQTFHGLRKIHLNNSVEDASYLNEKIGAELFSAAGVPAPRVGHVLVELNGRKLGLYVLKEGFTEDFLGTHFARTGGNLYEGSGHEITDPLDRDGGVAPDDPTDLKELAAASHEPDLARRWQRLENVLDRDRFVSFMAMEVMLGHRDGYCLARNNYRVYHDLDTGRMLFLPHGMDQLFGNAELPWQPRLAGLVAQAVMATPEGRRWYRERFSSLLTNVFNLPAIIEKTDRWAAPIRFALTGRQAAVFEREVAALKERLARRRRELDKQLSEPEAPLLQFQNGMALVTSWRAVDEPPGGVMDRANAPDGTRTIHIRAGPVTMASWRAKVRLPAGRYRFEGAVSTSQVEPPRFGRNQGAGLRVLGVPRSQPYLLIGDNGWKRLQTGFAVSEPEQDLEVICELRASRGEVWFDLQSLRLVRAE